MCYGNIIVVHENVNNECDIIMSNEHEDINMDKSIRDDDSIVRANRVLS